MHAHRRWADKSLLASAKMRSRAGLDRVNDPPHWPAKLSLVASRPGPWRGFGLLSPPAPRGFERGPGHLPNNEEARDQIQVSLPRPAYAPAIVFSSPTARRLAGLRFTIRRRQNCRKRAAPTIGPACPCCRSTAQRSVPASMKLCRSSCTVMALPFHMPIGISSRTTLL